jgi:hypothetical protein
MLPGMCRANKRREKNKSKKRKRKEKTEILVNAARVV